MFTPSVGFSNSNLPNFRGESPILRMPPEESPIRQMPAETAPPRESKADAQDLNKRIVAEKENSLVYQLMRAIARESTASTDSLEKSGSVSETQQNQSYATDFSLDFSATSFFYQSADFQTDGQNTQFNFQSIEYSTFEINLQTDDLQFNVTVEVFRVRELSLNINQTETEKSDPLVLDLGNDGINLSGLEKGFLFDLDGDGIATRSSLPIGNDALLAFDRNQNGVIDNGYELFGDQYGAANGFEELAKFDDNKDGVINSTDPVFEQLRLLQFNNFREQVLESLESANITQLNLQSALVDKTLSTGDLQLLDGSFEYKNGQRGLLADLLLNSSKYSL